MLADFLVLTLAAAGIALIWRDLLIDFPKLKARVKALPFPLGKALTCGSCFTYWLSLVFVLAIDPLGGWLPALTFSAPVWLHEAVRVLFSWMAFGTAAVTMRFTAVAVQELVHYQTHVLNEPSRHCHVPPKTQG
jgi:hypothetical protein